MRFLGIDYGKKRVGLAVSDETESLAFPYDTVLNNSDLLIKVLSICDKEDIDGVVIGESLTLSGKDNPLMRDITLFKKKILAEKNVDIFMEPEFSTTQEAKKIQGTVKYTDASAAAIILQRFLEKRHFKGIQN
ncbi:MAG: RuvX/YqgF family protein [Patescibacteria group bacterium]